jgi:hypothetical protein
MSSKCRSTIFWAVGGSTNETQGVLNSIDRTIGTVVQSRVLWLSLE